jgi:mycothiol synthase
MNIEIMPFDFRQATEDEYRLWNESRNRIRAEVLPDDPPIPLEEMVQRLKNFPPYMDYRVWAAWEVDEPAIVAYGEVWLPLTDNLHLAHFDIHVLPAYRRRGLARRLLALIRDEAQGKNRRLLMTDTSDRVPAGEAFMTRLGAERGLETHTNQLVIANLNWDLLSRWQEQARDRAAGFEIGLWEGPYPEADLDAVVALCDLLSQQPFGDLDIEEFQFEAEQVRQDEQSLFARGYERWTLYVRERSTGKFAGYTEVLWNPNRPEIISQGMTGVFPEYRNRGLGRWLKAAMLEKILAERPQAKYVRTGNADINAPMLKINTELGFKPYIAETVWQIATEQVSEYLG